ncbi:hypothetical protein GJ744_008672 [Endocarpon pusillum]|uniref:Uncharacterized protein n=1 Tax=Endocarpon pusillum TaxID=364733 RepID=A0A8H7E508_9EURO|nr:hypothetical protein GJ744_008672 [Endocarpon pusillum]
MHRCLSTVNPEEQTPLQDTSWLEEDSQHKDDVAQPPGATASPISPPEMSVGRGVEIDKRGQIRVVSRARAEKPCRTILIIPAASTSLTRADFIRLLPEKNRTDSGAMGSTIPGRHPMTLDRLPYWIVVFRTPFLAATYQSRLRWYHENAVKNLPTHPLQAALIWGRGLTPPPGYIDPESGEDVWKRMLEYSLLQPRQNFGVTALLPDFPPSIMQSIQRHARWAEYSQLRSWTVLVRIDGARLGQAAFARFLKEDGIARNRAWDIMSPYPPGTSWHDLPSHETPASISEEGSVPHGKMGLQIFGIKFRSEGEALRFWATWHRRPFLFLTEDASEPRHNAPLLHVETVW